MNRFFASIAGAATLIAAPASATGQERSVTVRYADLDLSSPAGKRALDRRIARATETVCGSYAGAGDQEAREIQECRAQIAAKRTARGEALVASR